MAREIMEGHKYKQKKSEWGKEERNQKMFGEQNNHNWKMKFSQKLLFSFVYIFLFLISLWCFSIILLIGYNMNQDTKKQENNFFSE